MRPGKVVDADSGAELADHDGVHGFTIGQRKGLGIEAPATDGEPRYVTEIDPDSGTVTVGSSEHLQVWSITANRGRSGLPGRTPTEPFEAIVQVRAHAWPGAGDGRGVDDGTDGVEGPGVRCSACRPR